LEVARRVHPAKKTKAKISILKLENPLVALFLISAVALGNLALICTA
jgi:hypothetical protein